MSLDENKGSLTGIRVIDLSRVLSGPYCTQMLADHGADVIKVEPPQGDETRGWGPPFQDGTASYFLGVNRNKRGVALDLTSSAGREALVALLDAPMFLSKTLSLAPWRNGASAMTRRSRRVFQN